MNNNNNNLIHYLNSELQTDKGKLIGIKRGYSIIEDSKFLNGVEYLDIDLTYYLYPLSCLTETIIHEGKVEIPLVELAKICKDYFTNLDYEIETNNQEYKLKFSDLMGGDSEFTFDYKNISFYLQNNDGEFTFDLPFNQLFLFQYIFSRRINIFPETIKSIDPRKLGENNPYLINK
jgi:hypothetical protein